MNPSRNFSWIVVALVAVAALMAAPAAPAQAKHELELASGLAYDFQMFDLAYEILDDYVKSPGTSPAQKDAAYTTWSDILLQEARVLRFRADRADGAERDRLTRLAEDKVSEATAKTNEIGDPIRLFGAKMVTAAKKLEEAESATEREDRDRMKDEAAALYLECLKGFHQSVYGFPYSASDPNPEKLQPEPRSLLYRHLRGDLDTAEGRSALRLSWYYLAECFFNVGKTMEGPDRAHHFDRAYRELDELVFEFEGELVGLYALLVMGDIQVARKNYNQATSSYDSVLDVEKENAAWDPGTQAAIDDLRMRAYQRSAEAYLKANNLDAVISTVSQMEADYPHKRNSPRLKVCLILKGEAMIKNGQPPAAVIKSLESFRSDPSPYFRNYFFRMLASVGKFPGLSLDLRMECARAAYGNNMFTDAAQIFQIILQNLSRAFQPGDLMPDGKRADRVVRLSDKDLKWRYEKYGVEAFWFLAESFARNWRFNEGTLVLIDMVRRYYYLMQEFRQYNPEKPGNVPDHLTDCGLFTSALEVRLLARTCIQKAKNMMTQWSPAASRPGASYTVPGSLEDSLAKGEIDRLERMISNELTDIVDMSEILDFAWNDAWADYVTAFNAGSNADYHRAIAGFMMFTTHPNYKNMLDGLRLCAQLMFYEFTRYKDRSDDEYFPEPDVQPDDEVLRKVRWGAGQEMYKTELALLERTHASNEVLFRSLPDGPIRAELIRLARAISEFPTKGNRVDGRVLYWHKSRYFYLKYLVGACMTEQASIQRLDPDAFTKSIGEVLVLFMKIQNERFLNGDKSEQNSMQNLALAAWQYGDDARNNPWSAAGPFGTATWFEKADAAERDDFYKPIAVDAWNGFVENFQIYFTNDGTTDAARKEDAKLRSRFQSITKWLIYFRFFLNYRLGNVDACIADVQLFDLQFPAEIRKTVVLDDKGKPVPPNEMTQTPEGKDIPQLQWWYMRFLQLLAQVYRNKNEDRLTEINAILESMYQVLTPMRDDSGVTWDDYASKVTRNIPETTRLVIDGLERGVAEYLVPTEASFDEMGEFAPRFPIIAFEYEYDAQFVNAAKAKSKLNDKQVAWALRNVGYYRTETADLHIGELLKQLGWLNEEDVRALRDEIDQAGPMTGRKALYPRLAIPQSTSARPSVIEDLEPLAGAPVQQVLEFARLRYRAELTDWTKPAADRTKLVEAAMKYFKNRGDRDAAQAFDRIFTYIYDGYRRLVFEYRDRVGNVLERTLNAFVRDAHRVQADALAYKYDYIQQEQQFWPARWLPERESNQRARQQVIIDNYTTADQYMNAGQYERGLPFLDRAFQALQAGFDSTQFAVQGPGGRPTLLKIDKGESADEVLIRYMYGTAYYQLATLSGDANSPYWGKAEEHLSRYYQFVQTWNYLRTTGSTGFITWEKNLKLTYYPAITAYLDVLSHLAGQAADARNVKVAFEKLTMVGQIHLNLSKQYPPGSPGERRGLAAWLETQVAIGKLNNGDASKAAVRGALDFVFATYLIEKEDKPMRTQRVLFFDVEYDTAVDQATDLLLGMR